MIGGWAVSRTFCHDSPLLLMDYDLIDPTGVAGLLHLMGLGAERGIAHVNWCTMTGPVEMGPCLSCCRNTFSVIALAL